LFPPASILDNFPHWRTYETVLAIVSFWWIQLAM
jgi:hypothetical protein